MHARVVELDPLSDADRAAADDDDAGSRGRPHLIAFVARQIVVGRARGKFGGSRIDHPETRRTAPVRIAVGELRLVPERNVAARVRELGDAGLRIAARSRRAQLFLAGRVAQTLFELDQRGKFPEPERIDRRGGRERFGPRAAAQRLGEREEALVRRRGVGNFELVVAPVRERGSGQRLAPEVEAAHRFHQGGAEGAADAHRFAGRFHLGAEPRIGARKLIERPARDLHDDVVERGLVGRFGDTGDGILDFVERHPERDFRRDLRDRIAGRFRGERRTPADARVDFDDVVLAALGVQRELDVAAAFDFQGPDDVEAGAAQHLIFGVGKRERRGDDDRISGVDSDGIDVLHVADDDAVVGTVAQDFVFDFLPAQQRAFDQRLMDQRDRKTGRERFA